MNWLYDPPVNYWLLAYLMVGLLGLGFVLALFGTGYAQTNMPTWYRRLLNAYVFPMSQLGRQLETRDVPNWIRSVMGGLTWLNLFVNLAIVAWPIERVLTKGWRAMQALF